MGVEIHGDLLSSQTEGKTDGSSETFSLRSPNLSKNDLFSICLNIQRPNTPNMQSNWAPGSHWSARVVC